MYYKFESTVNVETCSRKCWVYLFIGFACISYGQFMTISYKFKLSRYVQELLVVGMRGCVERDLNEETVSGR